MDRYKRIIDRLKNRNVDIKTALLFKKPEYLSIANEAIKDMEKRKYKRYSIKDYNQILLNLSDDKIFEKSCEIYLKNKDKVTRPSLTFVKNHYKKKDKYNPFNLMVNKIKKKKYRKTSDFDQYAAMVRQMKNSPDYDFMIQFDDIEKLRFLFLSIKNHHRKLKFDFTKEEKTNFISKFYYDKNFNYFYDKYLETGDKFLRPSLDHKMPRSKGGDNSLENLQFISYLENIAKSDMTLEEWNKTKNNLDKYFIKS